MAALFSAPKPQSNDSPPPSPPPPPAPTFIYTPSPPPPPPPPPAPIQVAAPTPGAPEVDPAKAAEAALARRNRGLPGTVLTSWRGLDQTETQPAALTATTITGIPARKKLLGE